jgi:hypothetical protein
LLPAARLFSADLSCRDLWDVEGFASGNSKDYNGYLEKKTDYAKSHQRGKRD